MENQEVTIFAETNFRGAKQKFGIKRDDRRKHMYVIGKSGMGKSVLLHNMIVQDIQNGYGVGVVDPHGDLAESLLDFIPPNRINDVIYFDPADVEYPIAFNVLESVDETHKHLVASGLMGVFKKIWPDVWSARMEYILNNTILALLDFPGSTMLGINRMLSNKMFREKVVENVKDPVVKSFWTNEFAKYTDKLATEATASVQNKVGQFLSASILRNIVGQPKSTIDMRQIMDSQKIFIANLSKGKLGEDNMKLLGGMLITKIQLAAMERVDIPEDERKDFYLYVDEFQNFATESFASILSEARKYRLNLIVAHQYIAQMKEEVRDAVFGNIGTLVCFRVGAADAEFLEKELEPIFTMNDLVNLAKYSIYLKLLIDGVTGDAFSAGTLAPFDAEVKSNRETIINVSREHYSNTRSEVEEKISRWIEVNNNEARGGSAPKSFPRNPSVSKVAYTPKEGIYEKAERKEVKPVEAEKHFVPIIPRTENVNKPKIVEKDHFEKDFKTGLNEAVCAKCGEKTYVAFVPDGKRPVYCKECLRLVREETRIKPKESIAPIVREQKPEEHKEKKEVDLMGLKGLLNEAMSEVEKEVRVKNQELREEKKEERENIVTKNTGEVKKSVLASIPVSPSVIPVKAGIQKSLKKETNSIAKKDEGKLKEGEIVKL